MRTKEVLLKLNPHLFSIQQPELIHSITVVGNKINNRLEYINKTVVNDIQQSIGIQPTEYIKCIFNRPQMKSNIYRVNKDILKSIEPDFFFFIKHHINQKLFYHLPDQSIKLLKGKVYGNIIVLNTPEYHVHTEDMYGNITPLTAIKLNKTTGKYERRPIIMNTYKFFANSDDIYDLLEISAQHYERHINSYINL